MNASNAQDNRESIKTAVQIDNLSVHYNETPALAGVCLAVDDKEYLGVIGPNGGGKTTLLRAILGLVPVSSGTIKIFGRMPGKTGTLVGYVPQFTVLDKSFPVTVREVVLMGRLQQKLSLFHQFTVEDKNATDQLLDRVGMYKLRGRQISGLSGGEFQKMLIARALVMNPRLLLLDEPTASVDARSRDQIFQLLEELNESMTIILVTHDLLAVSSYVRMLACLNGCLVYHGGTELNEGVLNDLYGCPIDLIAHGVPHRVLRDHQGGE